MRRWIETSSTTDLVIWSATFLLAAILALGITYAVWSHLPGFASIALMRTAQLCLAAGICLIALALPARVVRVFMFGFAVGLAGSIGFASHVFASASVGG
ncbi:MAG: hypothetical protein ACXWNJ_13235 [Vulcanimicrobiaceae bacterium]